MWLHASAVIPWLLLLIVGLLLFDITNYAPKRFQTTREVSLHNFYKLWKSQYRHCLITMLGRAPVSWGAYSQIINICNGNYARKLFDVKYFYNRGDVKVAIMPRVASDQDYKPECVLVTLGIGGDIDAELAMKEHLPNCRFHGADPIRQSGLIYETIGQYYETAVGGSGGYYIATVLQDGRYKRREVQAISFLEFLTNHANVSHIDYLLLDNEGPEYEILPQFFNDGLLEKNGIVVCQINVEMHGPLAAYGMDERKYNNLLIELLVKSPLLPLWSDTGYGHERSLYINAKHPRCVEKYLAGAFQL